MSTQTEAERAVSPRPTLGVQVFAGESDAPRDRRSADAFTATACAILAVGLGLVADDQFELDRRWSSLASSAPDWVGAAAGLFYFLAGLYLLVLIVGVAFVAHQRKDLLRDLIVAGLGSLATVVVLSHWVSDRGPELSFLTTDLETRTFPAVWLTILTAIHFTAAPHLSRPVRRIGWAVVFGVAITGLLADITTPRATLGGLLVGLAIGATTLFVFGSPKGRPSLARIRAAFEGLGIDVDELDYTDPPPARSTVVDGRTTDGSAVKAMVLGRDAEQTRYVAEAWRAAWHHDRPWPRTTRIGRVEHAALGSMLASAAGVDTPEVIAVGQAGAEDAVLITEAPSGFLADAELADIDDDVLDSLWALLESLHDAGISHGRFNAGRITLDDTGEVGIVDFSDADLSAGTDRRREDEAELLVSTVLLFSEQRALDAAARSLGPNRLAATVPYIQSAALTPALSLQARLQRLSIRKLRRLVADRAGVEDVELKQLHRVTIKQIITVAAALFAVYLLIGVFADVGLEATVDALAQTSIPIALVALVVAQLAEVGNAFAVLGASPKPLPFGIVTIQQFSINYVKLVVPSSAGQVAVNVRFAQKMGISNVNAMTLGALASLSGFAVQIFLLAALVVGGDWSIDWSQVTLSGTVLKLIAVGVVIGLVVLVIALVIRRAREWLASNTQKPIAMLRSNLAGLRDPRRLLRLFGGSAAYQLLVASALLLSALALGSHITIVEALFINTVVSLIAALMPVPGGIGITEAGLSAGLIAVGVPADSAFAIVLVFRLCTFYLPPIWGGAAMRWLTNNDYL